MWTHGTGDARYESHALWAYDAATRQVRVFEVNSLGGVELQVGGFNEADDLVVELREPRTNALLKRWSVRCSEDTLRMTAWFYSQGTATEHSTTLVRQR